MPPPHINRTSGSHVTVGETLVLTCSVSVNWNVMVSLSWAPPAARARPPRLLLLDPTSRNVSIGGSHLKVVEQTLKLHRVDKEDQGSYACTVTDHSGNKQTRREFVRIYERDQSFLKVWQQEQFPSLHRTAAKGKTVQWTMMISSHPPASVTWYDPAGAEIPSGPDRARGRTVLTLPGQTARSSLKLERLRLQDSGEYAIKVENQFEIKWENFTLEVRDRPAVELSVLEAAEAGLYQLGRSYTLQCSATGHPAPDISWSFQRCRGYSQCEGRAEPRASTVQAPNG